MAQASAHVSLPLLRPIPLDGLGAGGAIPIPVARVIGAPLPGAIAADLAILWIQGELALAVLVAALPLTRLGPGTPSVPDEIAMARTAVGRKGNTSAPSSQGQQRLQGKLTWKSTASPDPWLCDHPIDRLSATQK